MSPPCTIPVVVGELPADKAFLAVAILASVLQDVPLYCRVVAVVPGTDPPTQKALV